MASTLAKMDSAGRIVIPAKDRKRLGVKPGDRLVVVVKNDGLHIMTTRAALRRAQVFTDRYFSRDRKLADELIAERREEARREQGRP